MTYPSNRETLPAGPFSGWLNERFAYWEHRLSMPWDRGDLHTGAAERVCQEIGWSGESGARRLYRYRRQIAETSKGRNNKLRHYGSRVVKPADVWPRDVVEDALHWAGVPFDELYPEIAAAEDVVLEPARWCPGCREERTPIDGVCAFCDWRLGPPTGQVLQGRNLRKVAFG